MCEETKNYRTATITVRYEADSEAEALQELVNLVDTLEQREDVSVTDTTLNKKIAAGTMYYNANGVVLR